MRFIAPWILVLFYLPASAEILEGFVSRVIDGDTFHFKDHDRTYRIRLSEIDTPEMNQPWGIEARSALVSKVSNVLLKVNVIDTDRYGRKVAKVWFGGRDINRELVREGHAWVYERYLSDTTLLLDQAKAKEEAIGLWQVSDPISPWQWSISR